MKRLEFITGVKVFENRIVMMEIDKIIELRCPGGFKE